MYSLWNIYHIHVNCKSCLENWGILSQSRNSMDISSDVSILDTKIPLHGFYIAFFPFYSFSVFTFLSMVSMVLRIVSNGCRLSKYFSC